MKLRLIGINEFLYSFVIILQYFVENFNNEEFSQHQPCWPDLNTRSDTSVVLALWMETGGGANNVPPFSSVDTNTMPSNALWTQML